MANRLVVDNPRRLYLSADPSLPHNEAGQVRILTADYGGVRYQWFEGDTFDQPDWMPDEHLYHLLERGYVVEVAEAVIEGDDNG